MRPLPVSVPHAHAAGIRGVLEHQDGTVELRGDLIPTLMTFDTLDLGEAVELVPPNRGIFKEHARPLVVDFPRLSQKGDSHEKAHCFDGGCRRVRSVHAA